MGESILKMDRKVILTCAQPTGQLHLGNYFGALRNWAGMIDEFECYFGIVDLHAITLPYVPAELRAASYRTLALYIACGLDPARCHLFLQSQVTGHTELAWILGCLCPLGQLERMTQFKDKSQRQEGGFIGAGLLNYPVLMAADILIYNADRVPEVYIPQTGARVKSLQDPLKKMSKSDPNQSGCVYLLDPPATVRKKIRSAVTDSGAEVRAAEDKPGITNLLTLLSAATGKPVPELEQEFAGSQYGPFKEAVADAVVAVLEPIQKVHAEIQADKAYLDSVFKEGAAAAQRRANRIMAKVYRKAGFVPTA